MVLDFKFSSVYMYFSFVLRVVIRRVEPKWAICSKRNPQNHSKRFLLPPSVQYPRKKFSLFLEFRQMTGSCLSSGGYSLKNGSHGNTAKNGQMERGYA